MQIFENPFLQNADHEIWLIRKQAIIPEYLREGYYTYYDR